MKILLLGRTGQVGFRLQRSLQCLGEVIACDRTQYDFAKPETVLQLLLNTHPDVVINAVAWTAVDLSEKEVDATLQVNTHTPLLIAEAAAKLGALFITFSTDYVFGSGPNTPILETQTRAPLNAYGNSKALMEEGLEKLGAPFLNFRTTWVYDARGKNFLLTMLRLFREKEQMKVVSDQIGAPTSASSIAAAIALILTKLSNQKGSWESRCKEISGHYNLSNAGETSWFGFAEKIRDLALVAKLPLKLQTLESIPSSAFPTPAKRPTYSVLSHEKLRETFGVVMPTWDNALDLVFDEVLLMHAVR